MNFNKGAAAAMALLFLGACQTQTSVIGPKSPIETSDEGGLDEGQGINDQTPPPATPAPIFRTLVDEGQSPDDDDDTFDAGDVGDVDDGDTEDGDDTPPASTLSQRKYSNMNFARGCNSGYRKANYKGPEKESGDPLYYPHCVSSPPPSNPCGDGMRPTFRTGKCVRDHHHGSRFATKFGFRYSEDLCYEPNKINTVIVKPECQTEKNWCYRIARWKAVQAYNEEIPASQRIEYNQLTRGDALFHGGDRYYALSKSGVQRAAQKLGLSDKMLALERIKGWLRNQTMFSEDKDAPPGSFDANVCEDYYTLAVPGATTFWE